MRPLFILLLTSLLTACGYDRFGPLPPAPAEDIQPNTTLAELARLYKSGRIDLPDGMIASGTVTTSDSAGNFYKMIVVQQGAASLALLTGLYDTYAAYRPGQQVALKLDGLRLGLKEGMLCAGAPDGTSKGTDYIASEVLLRHILIRNSPDTENRPNPVDTLVLTIPGIKPEMAGRLVRITGGAFTQGGKQTWSGEKIYSEKRGVSVTVYTSDYATFANDMLPQGPVSLTGVVTLYRDKVQIKISSTDDVQKP